MKLAEPGPLRCSKIHFLTPFFLNFLVNTYVCINFLNVVKITIHNYIDFIKVIFIS